VVESERVAFRLRVFTPEFRRKCAIARKRVRTALERIARDQLRRGDSRALGYVAFSGGKDSTVVLDLVLAANPSIDICWYDDGWDYPETLEFLEATEARLGKHILRVTYPPEHLWAGADPDREHPSDMLAHEINDRYASVFLGLRAQESGMRRWLFAGRGYLYWHKGDKQWHCCPIYDWSVADVWAYIAEHELPYNAVYDRLAELGVPLEQRRVGPLTAGRAYRFGAMAILHRGWPFLFNRFVECVGRYPTQFT
jgi:phosphoadenosine phosphosulfate reductase